MKIAMIGSGYVGLVSGVCFSDFGHEVICDRIVDPQGKREGEALLPGACWYEAAIGAEAIVILTEWNEFRALDLSRLEGAMRSPKMADLRNIYNEVDVAASEFTAYSSVGR